MNYRQLWFILTVNTRIQITQNYIIQLTIPNGTNIVTLNSMFNDILQEILIENVNCSACNRVANYLQNTKIINAHQYFYFQIQLWNNFNNKIQNLVINSLLFATIRVDGQSYTLNSVICHHGPFMTQAHYTSIIKHTKKWVRCNDMSTSLEHWPRGGKDVYIKNIGKHLS